MRITTRAFAGLLIGTVALPSYAEISLVDHNKLESLFEENRAAARVAGILEYCENNGLRKSLIDKVAGDLANDAVKSRDKVLLSTSVSVLQTIDVHAKGIAMGLTLAQPTPAQKQKLCSFAVTFVDKKLAAGTPMGEP